MKMSLMDSVIKNEEIIEQMPGLFVVMDLESKFLATNKTALRWTGFKSPDAMIGETYHNMPCKIAELHDLFIHQDQITRARNNPLRILGHYCYADGWKILFGEKSSLKNKNGEIIASISHFNDITNYNLIDFSKFLNITTNENSIKVHKQQIEYIIENSYPSFSFTPRQSECMFFLLRGKTTKQIAQLLKLSPRTIEDHIEQIKYKLNCSTKPELIDKAIADGYMNIMPNSLLNQIKH